MKPHRLDFLISSLAVLSSSFVFAVDIAGQEAK
jgi:hypothetical protein